jgi:hypothetical protein
MEDAEKDRQKKWQKGENQREGMRQGIRDKVKFQKALFDKLLRNADFKHVALRVLVRSSDEHQIEKCGRKCHRPCINLPFNSIDKFIAFFR